MRAMFILLAIASGAGCSGPGPTAPSPPIPRESPTSPAVPLPTSVTFTVRSGAEGLPVVPGATIHTAGASPRTTDSLGRAVIDDVAMPAIYRVDAPGFLSYRSRVASPDEVVTLWPWQPGMTDWWIFMTSYYGPDYNRVLWRPDRDVRLELQGVLTLEPYRSVWENAVNQVAAAIESGGTDNPSIRLASGPGTIPVRLAESPGCELEWDLRPAILTPPPELAISAEPRARDPHAVLGIVTKLMGFNLDLSRRHGPPHPEGSLSVIERTAIRIRMLRPPGAAFIDWSTEDTTSNTAELAKGGWCR